MNPHPNPGRVTFSSLTSFLLDLDLNAFERLLFASSCPHKSLRTLLFAWIQAPQVHDLIVVSALIVPGNTNLDEKNHTIKLAEI